MWNTGILHLNIGLESEKKEKRKKQVDKERKRVKEGSSQCLSIH